jgi:hypothetical protein
MRRPIVIHMLDGARLHITAEIVGPFGVHRSRARTGRMLPSYTVTHVATGLQVGYEWADKRAAVRAAAALAGLPVRWNFEAAEDMPKRTMARARAMVNRLQRAAEGRS